VKCNCGVDHWHHVAAGLQGIVAMMSLLQSGSVPVSEAAMAKLECELVRLQELATKERERLKTLTV
jgi:hypothetical protein